MPSPLRSPKTLPDWFELDYFRRRRLFRGLWRPLLWGAVVAAVVGVGWTLLPGWQTAYEAGPLSTAHALFNHDCARCHTGAFSAVGRLWGEDTRSVPDEACRNCHAGPDHHAEARGLHCAECHREHNGQALLARVADNQCTACHQNLTRTDGRPSEFYPHVTGFGDGQHPEFRLWREGKPRDRGAIRFNHEAHLKGWVGISRRQHEEQTELVRKAGATPQLPDLRREPLTLECRSCHEPDDAGRYMRPIRYEVHCKECHPLSVKLLEGTEGPLKILAARLGQAPAPHPAHGETVATVRAALRDWLTRFIQDEGNKGFLAGQEVVPARPVPGWLRPPEVAPAQYGWVNRQLEQTERILFDGAGGCRYCHQEKAAPGRRPAGLPEYEPPGIKDRWYEHSSFRHASHRMLLCTECHAQAPASTEAGDVLLPGKDTCCRCHNPQVQARTDCVECHTYHDPVAKRAFRGHETIENCTRR
jgi:hypothetical protein